MTEKTLLEIGLTEEQAKKVMESLNGSFVTKERFDEVNNERKTLQESLKDRDTQLESLKNSNDDIEAFKSKISELQMENKKKDENHAEEIKQLKINSALEKALLNAKVKNPLTVKPLLKLENCLLNEDGTIKGLTEQLQSLSEAEDTRFLFDTENPKFKGFVPGEKKDNSNATITKEQFNKMSYRERTELFNSDKELYETLTDK